MWKQPPAEEVGKRWLATALELAEPGTEAEGFALLARALAKPDHDEATAAAGRALAIGEALGSDRLAVQACEARALIASEAGRFQEACEWVERVLADLPTIGDPGLRAHQYWLAGFVHLRGGRIADVPALAEAYDRIAVTLTPHDVVHAVALHGVLESASGDWEALQDLAPRVEATAKKNEETPCQFNWRTLLVCALGLAHLGEEWEATRLEERGRAEAVVYGPPEREPALLRLALLRGDLEEAQRILELLPARGDAWGLDAAAARLDALAALGDRSRVEEEAAAFVEERSYTRPFAFRALGLVRRDQGLLGEAASDFEAIGLEWRADETRALLPA
jgi:tetratricopeptide (TPR) repeat protein